MGKIQLDDDYEEKHAELNSDRDGSGSNNDADVDEDDADICPPIKPETKKNVKKKSKRKGIDVDAKGNPKLSGKKIKELQESEILGQSNLYRFQIEELLREIEIKSKVRVKIQEWLDGFKQLVNNLKPSNTYSLNSYKELLGGVQLPFPLDIHPKRGDKSTFRFTKPESIQEAGSWSYETAVGKLSAFDVVVEMPSDLFHKVDILNHVYFFKRAMYVAYIAKKLRNSGDDVKFTSSKGDLLKPILSVYIKNKKLLHVQIHFILPRSFEKFAISRLGPARNNVRPDHFLGVEVEGEGTGPATPSYNQSVVHDLLFWSTGELFKGISKFDSISSAIKLLKVWLTQRSLSEGFGSFSGFIMTMFVAYLAHHKKIHENMSSYQIIRFVLVHLSEANWSSTGLSFEPVEKQVLANWHLAHEVVFLDPSGNLNFTTNMSRMTFNRVRHEATLALEYLNSTTTSGFQSMFITKVPFFLNFDNILQLNVTTELLQRFKTNSQWNSHYLNFSGYHAPLVSRIVTPLIEKCLRQRVDLIDFQLPEVTSWEITEAMKIQLTVRFGLIINREFAFKLVEKCESEDFPATQAFKEFWGDKSQLRRFMDGTMTESVTFEDPKIRDRIPFQMLKYILQRHLDIELESDSEEYLDTQLDRLLEPELIMKKFEEPARFSQDSSQPKRKKARFVPPKVKHKGQVEVEQTLLKLDDVTSLASKSLDELSKTLRQLEGLPLDITSVQGTSPVLRFANITPAPPRRFATSKMLTEKIGQFLKIKETASKVPKYVETIGVVVQLEASGKWPDDLAAIERLKCAFLIRIGQLLQDQFSLTVQVFPRYLLVLKDGFIFRIRLTYFRELILLKQMRGEDGILRSRDNAESLILERESLILPQLTSTLNSIHRQFGAFGHTCRLAKRWLASQLLLADTFDFSASNRHPEIRFTEESIELLVASLFLHPAPFLFPPNESQLGFLRFLNLLGTTDWKSTPFVLNFNEKLDKRGIEKIEVEFVKRRDTLPLLFISTPEDRIGSVWTKYLAPPILQRGGILGKFGIDTILLELNQNSTADKKTDWKKLFTPSLKVFDGIIWLKKNMIGKGNPTKSLSFTEYKKCMDEVMPIVDFDPIRIYFQELRETFTHLCHFVNDVCGGNFIAFAWKPEGIEPRNFEISQVRGRKLGNDGKSLVVDIDAILEEMEVMGEGIVDHIELKKKGTTA